MPYKVYSFLKLYFLHTGSPDESGQNLADRVCNIFDLEGNYYENVAEKTLPTIAVRLSLGEAVTVLAIAI